MTNFEVGTFQLDAMRKDARPAPAAATRPAVDDRALRL
jgi:hypothetical protein